MLNLSQHKRRNYLVSGTSYHVTTKFFTEHLLAIEIRKTEILVNQPVYLGLLMLYLNQILKYEVSYDYEKLKYGEKAKLLNMDTGSFHCIHKNR